MKALLGISLFRNKDSLKDKAKIIQYIKSLFPDMEKFDSVRGCFIMDQPFYECYVDVIPNFAGYEFPAITKADNEKLFKLYMDNKIDIIVNLIEE